MTNKGFEAKGIAIQPMFSIECLAVEPCTK